MRSNAGPLILLSGFLALFSGAAWLTRHPDAAIVRRAESWPFLGTLAREFRRSFTPPEVRERPAGEEKTVRVVEYVEPSVAPIGEGFVWVVPGTVLHREPSRTSQKILQFDVIANVVRLERRGDWYRIWRRGKEGWIYLEGYDEGVPPYGSEPEAPLPLPSLAPREDILQTARSFLSKNERLLSVGPYKLYTNVENGPLLSFLDRVAGRLEQSYIARYGRRPLDGESREVVVIYKEESAYRKLQARSDRLEGLRASGHTVSGLVAFYRGGRSREELTATLVHELVHTLNRRSLGPALPPWLDEGLADDLASSKILEDGRILPGSLGGARRRSAQRITMDGGLGALFQLREDAKNQRLLHIRELLHLDWHDFVRGSSPSGQNYAAAAFWVRFLLEAEEGRYSEAFLEFLRSISEGRPATPEALRSSLGESWNLLDARYRLWIEFRRFPQG